MATAIVGARRVLTAGSHEASPTTANPCVPVAYAAPVALGIRHSSGAIWQDVPRPASATHSLRTIDGNTHILRVYVRG